MDEQSRLEALIDYAILDTPPESDFDRLTQLAAFLCETPIATVSLVDDKRQWFKSALGLTLGETERAIAFCAHAVESRQPLMVEDARLDPRFAKNPLVTDAPHLRFYAGIPLISPAGFALGTLAVMDLTPRSLTPRQMEHLDTLAQQVMVLLELRRQRSHLDRFARQRTRNIISAAGTGIAVTNLDGFYQLANPAFCRMLGYTETEMLQMRFTEILHPDELEPVLVLVQSLAKRELSNFVHDTRCIKKSGDTVWSRASVSLICDEDGQATGRVVVTEDITSRREAEARERHLAERLVNTFESITDAFYTLDSQWRLTYLNSEAERLLRQSREHLLGENIWLKFPDTVGTLLEKNFRRAIEQQVKISFEEFYLPLQTWFRINVYPSNEGLSVYFQDVSEQREAQQQLHLLENCVARMNDILIITEAEPLDEPGPRILFVNDAFVKRTGYRRAEVIGRSPRFLQGLNTSRTELNRIKSSMQAWQPVRAEIINYTRSGEEFWVEMDLFPIANGDGQFTHWVGMERDITQRKKNEQAIRESEERFKLVSKATADAIWDWDLVNDHMWWSESIQALFGVTPNQIEVDRQFWIDRIHADDKQRVLATIDAVINSDGKNWVEEYRLKCNDNSYAYVQDRGFVIRSDSGKAVRLVGGMTDLTLAKKTEIEYERLQENKRKQELATLTNQTRSKFLATMSHEIRTPISGVIGMVDVLQQTSLKGYQVEMVDIIRDSAYSLLNIIDDILDFSKIEAGKLDIESAPLSPAKVLKSVCVMLDRLAENKSVELTLFVDPALPDQVLGDSFRLRQVLINLINNAIKFCSGLSRPGKVSVRVSASNADAEKFTLQFQVIDNGIGMSPATIERLFNPFVQADASTTRNFGGTGLGLAISRHLVELMNGEISVASQLDHGSVFTLLLPVAVMSSEHESTPMIADLSDLNCVLVGNEQSLVADFAIYLRAEGVIVNCVTDLHDGAEHLLRQLNPPAAGPWIWIVDAPQNNFTFNRLRGSLPEQWQKLDVRWLLVGRGKRRKPRREQYDATSVDANVLDRHSFLRALAIAAGRAEEEITPSSKGKQEIEFLPPDRALAIQQKRLVLIAEDNETNQKVIQRQLSLLGYAADTTSNGREALHRWRSGDYSLLLTDLSMPDMDGYMLAQAIRTEENGLAYLPIIALSANALRGEAERCREFGIDEYLTKPASLTELQSVLEQWLPHAEAIQVKDNLAIEQRDFSALDTRVLEELVGSEPEVVNEFLQDFRLSLLAMSNEMHLAKKDNHRRRMAAVAHKLKSSARSVGALELGEICARLETICNEEAATPLKDILEIFDKETEAVNNILEQRLGSWPHNL